MKYFLILALGLLAGATTQLANAIPPRMEDLANIRLVTQELKRDTQDLLANARSYAPHRNDHEYGRYRQDDRHDQRHDNFRAFRDLEALSRDANELDYAIDRNDSASTENYYNHLSQSYQQVLSSFGDARVLEHSNIKSAMWRIIKDIAKLRFYYEVANGGWIGAAVRQYAEKLETSANLLALETARLRNSQDRELVEASERFSRSASHFNYALHFNNDRSESSKDEFFRLKSAYDNLENRLGYSSLPDEVVSNALAAFDNYQSVSVYYLMLTFNPDPQPVDHRFEPKIEHEPEHGHWMHERVSEQTQQITNATNNLNQALSKDFDVIFGGDGKKAAVRAVSELDNQVKRFAANLRTHRESPRETLEDLKLLDQKCDIALLKMKSAGLGRYLNQLTEIDHQVEALGRMYQYSRPPKR